MCKYAHTTCINTAKIIKMYFQVFIQFKLNYDNLLYNIVYLKIIYVSLFMFNLCYLKILLLQFIEVM